MAVSLASYADVTRLEADTIIDVRSPAEFEEDRLPGAINLPALSNEERAEVGTIYKQDSPFKARKVGAALVARNVATHLQGPLAEKEGGWRPLVYCWRGGQRSGSFATILQQIGWRADVIDGGYRAYRRVVNTLLYDAEFPAPIVLLDGNTGSAKTDILGEVKAQGGQVLDLEGLANHRGSLFGWMGEQPSQRAFESALAAEVSALDPGIPVLVEAESSKIGQLILPPSLLKAMRTAPRILVEAPLEARARYLVARYGDIVEDKARLAEVLERLRGLQSNEQVDHWQGLAAAGQMEALAADLMDAHYDPRYAKMRSRHDAAVEVMETAALAQADLQRIASKVCARLNPTGK